MGNVPQQVGQLTRKQSSPTEDVDGAAAVLFPLPELKLCLFSGTGYNDGFNAGLMKSSSSLESLEAPSHNKSSSSSTNRQRSSNISPSGKRYRVIRAYPNPDSSLYLLKVKGSSGPTPAMCLTSLPSLKARIYSDCE